MPMFTFQCSFCEKRLDKIVKNYDTAHEADFECPCERKEKLVFVPTFASNFTLKGTWFKTNGEY